MSSFAIDDGDDAVFVHHADVAGIEEAVRAEAPSLVSRRDAVALIHLRAADRDLAHLALAHVLRA